MSKIGLDQKQYFSIAGFPMLWEEVDYNRQYMIGEKMGLGSSLEKYTFSLS